MTTYICMEKATTCNMSANGWEGTPDLHEHIIILFSSTRYFNTQYFPSKDGDHSKNWYLLADNLTDLHS